MTDPNLRALAATDENAHPIMVNSSGETASRKLRLISPSSYLENGLTPTAAAPLHWTRDLGSICMIRIPEARRIHIESLFGYRPEYSAREPSSMQNCEHILLISVKNAFGVRCQRLGITGSTTCEGYSAV